MFVKQDGLKGGETIMRSYFYCWLQNTGVRLNKCHV